MSAISKLAAAPALAALAALSLAACGGSGSSTSAGSTSSTAVQGSTATAPGAATTAKAPQGSHPSSGSPAKRGSAPFRVKSGDNSIPDFGSEAAASQRKRAAAALTAYLGARAAGDWGKACAYLAALLRSQLDKFASASKGKVAGCAGVLGALEAHTPPIARADPVTHGLVALRIKDGHGFALFYGPHDQQYVMPLASKGGAWKVGQLAPIPYPLGSQPPSQSSRPPGSP